MARNFRDVTGDRYGMLVCLRRVEKPEGAPNRGGYWLCRCDCGKEVVACLSYLRAGNKKSCGCANHRPCKVEEPPLKIVTHPKPFQTVLSNTARRSLQGISRVCPECGATFVKTGKAWGYKIGQNQYCTYKCMRRAEKRTALGRRTEVIL